MSQEIARIPLSDIEIMARNIAASGLFGTNKPEQAMSLMLIAQAEGLHPAIAARDYHIIQGKPALKSDAMLARFQTAGGKVEWHSYSDDKVCATFSHPSGGSATVDWDMQRAKAAQLGGKDMWRKFPRQMLKARVISEGIRLVFPGVVSGVYAPEEVMDFDDKPRAMQDVTPPQKRSDASGRVAKALEFIGNAPSLEKLDHIVSTENFRSLLQDVDGTEDKNLILERVSSRREALSTKIIEAEVNDQIPQWMQEAGHA